MHLTIDSSDNSELYIVKEYDYELGETIHTLTTDELGEFLMSRMPYQPRKTKGSGDAKLIQFRSHS
jgi:hypothetical protein